MSQHSLGYTPIQGEEVIAPSNRGVFTVRYNRSLGVYESYCNGVFQARASNREDLVKYASNCPCPSCPACPECTPRNCPKCTPQNNQAQLVTSNQIYAIPFTAPKDKIWPIFVGFGLVGIGCYLVSRP
jgi:hypothetical protein